MLSFTLYARAAIPRSLILACLLDQQFCFSKDDSSSHLCERARIKLVFAGNFQSHVVARFRIPGCLGTCFYRAIDHVIVACREDSQVIGSLDRGGILLQTIPDRSRVLGDSRLLDIIACFGADKETFVSKHGVNVGGGAFEEVEEGAEVEVGLLIVEIQFPAVGLFGWKVIGEDFGFEALGELVFKFDFGIERI